MAMKLSTIMFLAASAITAVVNPVYAQTAQSTALMPYDGYVLGVNDSLEVSILNSGQSQSFKSRIKEDGSITVPFIGSVQARDRTARQLAAEITQQLKSRQIFANPIIGVEVVEFVSNSAVVSGEVGTPGIYPLDRPLTVGSIMARAGGTKGNAADYVLLRRAGQEHRVLLAVSQGEWSSSTTLERGDELYVPAAPTIYVYGQVRSGGSYAIKSGTTVRQALARAGGPTLAGSEKNISLHRDGQEVKKINLDDELRDGDVLFIHERLF